MVFRAATVEFFNSCRWSWGPRPQDENGSGAALVCAVDGPSVARSAQPGAASPINSWTPGAPGHDRLLLPSGKHADQTLQWASTPLGRSSYSGKHRAVGTKLSLLVDRAGTPI